MPARDQEQPDRRQGSGSSGISQETVRNIENLRRAPNDPPSNGRNEDIFPGILMDR